MAITSNGVQNNQNRSGNLNTTAAKRAYRTSGGTITIREGETLKGVVSDIHGNVITISMDDGSSFSGKLPEASQYSIGQKAAFQITSMENGTIYMKAISHAYLLGMEDTIEQALEEAGLPKSPRNLEIVRSLLENQQSISRDNIMNSLQLCAKYPSADVNTVISMKRLGMPMDPTTVAQFDNYRNQSHQLLYRMNTLTDSVNELLADLVNENPSIARYAAKEVLDISLNSLPSLEEFNLAVENAQNNPENTASDLAKLAETFGRPNPSQPEAANGSGTPVSSFPETGQPGAADVSPDASLTGAGQGNPADPLNAVNSSDMSQTNGANAADAANGSQNPLDPDGSPVNGADSANASAPRDTGSNPDALHEVGENGIPHDGEAIGALTDTGKTTDANMSPLARMRHLFTNITDRTSSERTASGEKTVFIPEQTGHIIPTQERLQLADLLSRYTNNPKLQLSLEDGTLTARELLSGIRDILPSLPDKELHALLTSKTLNNIIKGQFLSGWTISPEGLKEGNSMERLYGKIQEQLTDLTNLSRMFATRTPGENIINTTTDMQQNMEFMKLLGEQFAYMQLPIKLSEQNAHGDLYVMTRKDTLKKSKDNLKVLLHLEMDYLGTLDIHITKDHTNISAKFFVEKDSARKLLEKNTDLLKDAINEQGYSFTSEFANKEKNVDIVHDFIEQDSPAPVGNLKRYNFDLRA